MGEGRGRKREEGEGERRRERERREGFLALMGGWIDGQIVQASGKLESIARPAGVESIS